VVLRAIWNIKPRLFDHDFVANPRNSGAIAVVCASSWPKIHRFYLFHPAHNTTLVGQPMPDLAHNRASPEPCAGLPGEIQAIL
jgi:hypothetical protein